MLVVAVLAVVLGGCGGNSSSNSSTGGSASSGGASAMGGGSSGGAFVMGGGSTTASTSGMTGNIGTTAAKTTIRTVQLTQSRNSGISGKATFTNTKGGVRVVLSMKNLSMNVEKPGTRHLAHIHQPGTCANDRAGNGAQIEYPLKPLYTNKNGNGKSTTVIKGTTVQKLFSGAPKYVNVHAMKKGSEKGIPHGVSCGNLSSGGGTT